MKNTIGYLDLFRFALMTFRTCSVSRGAAVAALVAALSVTMARYTFCADPVAARTLLITDGCVLTKCLAVFVVFPCGKSAATLSSPTY